MSDLDRDPEHGVVVEERQKVKRPPMYKVLLHNDDYTTMEFVVWVLEAVFFKSKAEATRIMLHVHATGVGVAGIFTRDVAESKARKVEAVAQAHEYPLKSSVEPA
jgi:ATP-dependent Clp protease adaptor protein ClpS